MSVITLRSKIDPSVNTVLGQFETRFVARDNGTTAAIYLSSAKGCDRACRMCWLTQQGQTSTEQATLTDYVTQAVYSLNEAKAFFGNKLPNKIHFNFMARGEPMMNKVVTDDWEDLSNELLARAAAEFPGVKVSFKISTIMAGIYERDENGTILSGYQTLPFKVNLPDIYYSLYSVDELFRKRWIPKAEDPKEMLRLLASYKLTGGRVIFHSAFILGHNDDLVDIDKMVKTIKMYGLGDRYSIVRFNTPDASKWVEPELEYLLEIKKFLESKGFEVQMVDRVGNDIYGSCGMFIKDEALQVSAPD